MTIFLQYFLAPIITGAIIFIAQFFLLPRLEKNKTAQVELWREKKDAFIKSVELIDEKYQSLDFGKGSKSIFSKSPEVNKIYIRLLILSENKDIPNRFWKFFDNSKSQFTPIERGEYILLLAKELGSKNDTQPDEIPYIYE